MAMTDTFIQSVDMYTRDLLKLSRDLKKSGYKVKLVTDGQQRLYSSTHSRLINTCSNQWREFVMQVMLLKRKGDIYF